MGRRPGLSARCGCGAGPQAGMHRCGIAHVRAPGSAAGEQCIMESKIDRMKNRLNPKQVSFVIPMNISVVAFSRTFICGWLSSCWLPKSHHTTHTCLCLMSLVFCIEPLKNGGKLSEFWYSSETNRSTPRMLIQKQKWASS